MRTAKRLQCPDWGSRSSGSNVEDGGRGRGQADLGILGTANDLVASIQLPKDERMLVGLEAKPFFGNAWNERGGLHFEEIDRLTAHCRLAQALDRRTGCQE